MAEWQYAVGLDRPFLPVGVDNTEQVNYYVRLTLDVDGVNSQETLELLGVLYARPDLSWKVRQDVDKLMADRQSISVPGADRSVAGGDSPTTGPHEPQDGGAPKPEPKRLYWAIGAVAAAAADPLDARVSGHDREALAAVRHLG